MTNHNPPSDEPAVEPSSHDALASLLQKALAQPPEPHVRFLPGVQERIRLRTRGRYFGARRAVFRDPLLLLLMAALLILMIGVVVFLVLEPLMSSGPPTKPGPAPAGDTAGSPRPR